MYIWNKVLIGLIFVATIPFVIFAAQALKTHAYWRTAYNAHVERISAISAQNDELIEGTDSETGVRRLTLELHKLMLDRGRIWRNCVKQQVDPPTGAMRVKTALPKPNGISTQTVLYAFDETPVQQGGSYLGQFQVREVAEDLLTLVPARKFSPEQIQRIQTSRGTISLYDILPYDNHEAFAGLTDEEIKVLLARARPDTIREYLKHGKPADADDPQNAEIEGVVVRRWRDDDGNYVRQLRDYEILLQSHHARRSLLTALKEASIRDKQYIETALADARIQVQFREDEKAELQARKTGLQHEVDVVAAHQNQLQEQLAEVRRDIQDTLVANEQKAEELAQVQNDAARLIEQKVRSIARGGSMD